ncbi:MAG: hypothetical protein UW70_C0094G0002 [Candidatus Peregrinibacteria bacterium GW2011_GWA2_44_7]|nr:MAG: hypothetical protein UW70_C0094G0002 [Candidatus Peregrinibacteria bacterium GW2011_GWA2_44_7]
MRKEASLSFFKKTFSLLSGLLLVSTLFLTTLMVEAAPQATGNATYQAINSTLGNLSTLDATFSENLTNAGSIQCPGGVPGGSTCYATNNVTLGGAGYAGGVTVTALFRDTINAARIFVVLSQSNAISNIGAGPTVSFNGFAGITTSQTFTVVAAQGGQQGAQPGVTVMNFNAISPGGSPVGVIKYVVGSEQNSQTLTSIKIRLTPGIGTPTFNEGVGTSSVVEDTAIDAASGFSIWKSGDGFFDFGDDIILLNGAPTYASNTLTLTLSAPLTLTTNDTFFVVMRPDDRGVIQGQQFSVGINNGDIVTSGADPSFANVITGTISMNADVRIVKVELIDQNTNGTQLEQGDKVKLHYNQEMNLGDVTASNLENMIPVFNPTNFTKRTWGSNPTVGPQAVAITADTLVITLGANPTITTGDEINPSIQSLNNPTDWLDGVVHIDNQKPTLISAKLSKDAGNDGLATTSGDVLVFTFSESMDYTKINSGNVQTALPPSSGTYSTTSSPNVTWIESNSVKVQLTSNQTNTMGATVNPADSVKDLNGNSDNTLSPPTISISNVSPSNFITLVDSDTTNLGVDGFDMSFTWSAVNVGDHYDLYVLPESTSLDTSTQFRVNNQNIALNANSYSGNASLYNLSQDSRFNYTSNNPSVYYPIRPNEPYKACIVVVAANEEKSAPTCSSSTVFNTEAGIASYDQDAPYIVSKSPFDGQSVAPNTIQALIGFNERMKADTITTTNIKVFNSSNQEVSNSITKYLF